jgi:hypothetical protein
MSLAEENDFAPDPKGENDNNSMEGFEQETVQERKVRERRTGIQSIQQYLLGNIEELTDKEEELFDRYKWIQMVRTKMDRAGFMAGYCERYGVSVATAARDLAISNKLFGDQFAKEKEGLRAMWIERADVAYAIAAENEDVKGMNEASKIAARLLGNPDKEQFIPDREQLGNNLYIFAPSKELERSMMMVAELLKGKGRLDLSKFPVQDAEIIEENDPK